MWVENCIGCFVDQQPFDHPKETCNSYTGQLASHYRFERMGGSLGKPQCYSCFMPMRLCAKWTDRDTGEPLLQRDSEASCTYPHSILDTWACLWERCPKAKALWLTRIAEESKGKLDGENSKDFATYFRQITNFGGRLSVGRIALDVNWLTHGYFIGDEERWTALR